MHGLHVSHQCCQSIVGALMATGMLSKPLSKPSTLGTTPLIAMFQVLTPPPMEMLAVQPMEVLAGAAGSATRLLLANGRDGAAAPPPHE
jgi:hypothetical protein